MSLPVLYRPLARAEFLDAIDTYETASAGLGQRFTDAVEAVVGQAAVTPDRYPVAEADVREAPVPGFPYCVYYRERANRLVVVAVYHQSRDPAGWRTRR